MTKIYCDKCEQPINDGGMGNNPNQEGQINIKKGRLIFNVSTSIAPDPDSEENHAGISIKDIHICLYCRLDALDTLDKRD